MASARALDRTQPVASLTHWLLCEAVHSASDLSRRSHLLLLKLRGPYGVDCVPAYKTPGSHNPRAKDGLGAVYVRTCHLFTRKWVRDGTWVVRVWNGHGTGMERYGTGSGTKRPTPAQLCHHAAHLYQNWQFGARVAQQAILRLPAGSSQAHLHHQTAQLCHSG